MELHELGIGDGRAGASGDGDALASGVGRIGGHGVESADTAGCEDDSPGTVKRMDGGGVICAGQGDACDAVAGLDQRKRAEIFEKGDGRRAADGLDHGLHNGKPGSVAGHANDAIGRMGRLAREDQTTFEILVERDTVGQQIPNPVPRLCRDEMRDPLVDDTCACLDCVRGVQLRRVAFANGRRDATLRPRARSAFTERSGRDESHRRRGQLQCCEQASETRADDHDIAARGWCLSSPANCHRKGPEPLSHLGWCSGSVSSVG